MHLKTLRTLVSCLVIAVALGSIGVAGWSQPHDPTQAGAPPIRLRSGTLYLQPTTHTAALLSQGEDGRALFLVQFTGPIRPAHKQGLTRLGAEVGDYLPDLAFLVRMTGAQARQVAKLPAVRAVERYRPELKLDPALVNLKGPQAVRAVSFGDGPKGSMAGVAALGAPLMAVGERSAVARLDSRQVRTLAQSDNVVYIEPVRANRLFNDKAAGIIEVPSLWQSGLDGAGQVIGVADTGLDTGNLSTMHPDLKDRVKEMTALGRSGDASDPHGHGTHVAGSIAGTGAASGGSIKGMAPGARLVFQSVLDFQGGLGGIPEDIGQVFRAAYDAGARIHSDSWGVPATQGGATYDAQAAAVDRFIWENGDMSILFAAGNDGDHNQDGRIDYGTVSSPGTAKNAITVGASENNRPDRGRHADNPAEVAVFSSRGLTGDSRVKPDVVAPGSWILSVKSSRAPEGNFWQGYDDRYAFMGGTSMATPLTAGAVALLRQHFMQNLNITPRASLIRAAVINGAVSIQGGAKDYGWGRVDMKRTLASGTRYENEPATLATGEERSFTYQAGAGQPLRVTLAWSDYPANPGAARTLVNDLDLEVRGPDGKVLQGNHMLGSGGADRVNNVENVLIQTPAAGAYTVTVKAYNVPQAKQPFSLVVSGQLEDGGQPPQDPPADPQPPEVRLTAPAPGATVRGRVTVSAEASDAGSGVDRVEFRANGGLIGTAKAAPYQVPWETSSAPNGSVTLTATAYDRNGNRADSAGVTVTVDNTAQPPAPPVGDAVTTVLTGRAAGWGGAQRLQVDAGAGTATLRLARSGQFDVTVAVYGPDGKLLAKAPFAEAAGGLQFDIARAGTQTVWVYTGAGYGNWHLTLTHPAAPGAGAASFAGTVGGRAARAASHTVKAGSAGVLYLNLGWEGSGDLDLYLVNNWGGVIARADSPTLNPETLALRVQPGTYTVYVVADSGEGAYRLTARHPK